LSIYVGFSPFIIIELKVVFSTAVGEDAGKKEPSYIVGGNVN
jgi:hypothetical protein